ncbi:class I SAM-dependent methyltransferase [Mucisphaera sp.]|uniref:class I SAM-dependent methyltransferase n=1 Tax=Mucisphaera sp. TaxID=2913024 RepID=UPI003D0DF118
MKPASTAAIATPAPTPDIACGNTAGSSEFLSDLYTGLGSQRNDFRNYNLNRLIAAMVIQDQPNQGRNLAVLDIGCGSGVLTQIMTRLGMKVTGLEPNPDLAEAARLRDNRMTIHTGDGSIADQLNQTFDCITIIDVLEHIEDDIEQLHKIRRALKPGGRLVVLVPAYQCLFGKRDVRNGHFRRYSAGRLRRRVERAGMIVDDTRYWNAIGVIPYFIAERILRRELDGDIRTENAKGPLQKAAISFLHFWYRKIENTFNLGVGLSAIAIAHRPENDADNHQRNPSLLKAKAVRLDEAS